MTQQAPWQSASHHPLGRQPSPPGASAPLVGSATLLVIGGFVATMSTFLPWYVDSQWDESAGAFVDAGMLNGWELIQLDIGNHESYGTLLLVALLAATVAGVCCVVAAAVGLAGRRAVVPALTGALLGLIAGFGVLIGYLMLGTLDEMAIGGWIFCFSFLPALAGAIGHSTRSF